MAGREDEIPDVQRERFDDEQHARYAGPFETGPLGEPIEDPIPRGTLLLLGLFLIFLVVLWLFAYLSVWDRGVS